MTTISNINVLKEVEGTESFYQMDNSDKECQNEETLQDCTSRHYRNTLLKNCDCLPFDIRVSNKVPKFQCNTIIFLHRYPSRDRIHSLVY